MTASDFDRAVRTGRAALNKDADAPNALERMVLDRLSAGSETYDSTLLEVVYAWREFESRNPGQTEKPFARTLALIDELLTHAGHKAALRSVLYIIRGEITYQERLLEPAAEAFLNAVDEMHALHLDVDVKRIYAMVMLGDILIMQGNKTDAEKLFLDVLSYPWYLIRESDIQGQLRAYYVRAGRRLIECRRGNLKALQNIFFVPATEPDLLPTLKRAIAEAQQGSV